MMSALQLSSVKVGLHLPWKNIQTAQIYCFSLVLISILTILPYTSGLHNLPGEEWVDLGVAALTLQAHVPVDEAKTCSPSVLSFMCHCVCSVAPYWRLLKVYWWLKYCYCNTYTDIIFTETSTLLREQLIIFRLCHTFMHSVSNWAQPFPCMWTH